MKVDDHGGHLLSIALLIDFMSEKYCFPMNQNQPNNTRAYMSKNVRLAVPLEIYCALDQYV